MLINIQDIPAGRTHRSCDSRNHPASVITTNQQPNNRIILISISLHASQIDTILIWSQNESIPRVNFQKNDPPKPAAVSEALMSRWVPQPGVPIVHSKEA